MPAESDAGPDRLPSRRRHLSRQIAVLGLSAAAGFAAIGVGVHTWVNAGPRIEDHGFDESTAGVALSSPVAGPATLTMDLGPVCLDDEGSVELVSVVPYRPLNGFRVTDFGLVDSVVIGEATTSGIENERSTFAEALEGRSVTRTLTHECVSDGSSPNLIVELRKPAAESVQALGYHVHYTSAGRLHRTFNSFGMHFCEREAPRFCGRP